MVTGEKKLFRDFSDFLADYFDVKMQKLSVDLGRTCPNRDGKKGYGGCSYCNNATFTPGYCREGDDCAEQLRRGKTFFCKKYPNMRYLAYFQAFTPTYAPDDEVMARVEEAFADDDIRGVVIGTRPDCMTDNLLRRLHDCGRFAMVEYGAETSHDATLRAVNRCHTWAETVDAVKRTHDAGLPVGLHFINGLPGEGAREVLQTVERVNTLPVDVVKFHQLQVVKGTRLCRQIEHGEVDVINWTLEEYVDLCCKIVGTLRGDIAIDRFVSTSPDELLVSPRWGVKNYEFMNLLRRAICSRRR